MKPKTDPNGNPLRRPRSTKEDIGAVDWTECDSQLLRQVVAKASYKRCALRLGYTRDGGAFAIGVYAGEQYFTDYVRPHEDIDQYLGELLECLDEYQPGDAIETKAKRDSKH